LRSCRRPRLTDYERVPVGAVGPALDAIAWALAIAVVALALWRRRVRIHGSTSGAGESAVPAAVQ
jgi:hypothetical protein